MLGVVGEHGAYRVLRDGGFKLEQVVLHLHMRAVDQVDDRLETRNPHAWIVVHERTHRDA
jgi:hypothetical protein